MPLFSPLLRLFMVFLNIWDTFKTLKEPPSKHRRGPEGEYYGPSSRAVVQRKRDLKGCLAVWIVWCCFTLYERILEPIVYLFIPFYDELKAIALLFLILTRARGAEPIFLHIVRPFLRPYNKTIDSVLELARMIGDMLFALSMIPLGFLKSRIHGYVPWFGECDVDQVAGQQEGMKVECTVQNGTARSHTDEARIYGSRASQRSVVSQQYSNGEGLRHLSNPAPHQQPYPYLHLNAAMFPGSVPSTPDEVEAELEWRRYAPLPSAYPPTPLVGSSTLPPKRPISSGFDAVPEDNEQDFYRSLLPPREPLNPGSGKRGLSDEEDGGSNTSNTDHNNRDTGDLWVRDNDHGTNVDEDMKSDNDERDKDYDDDDDDDDDEEDEFNVTLQTPKAPLPLHPRSGSTIRTRASARSLMADMERGRKSFLAAPALASPSLSGQSTSTRLTTNDDGSSLRTGILDGAGDSGSLSDSESLSASASVSVSDVSDSESMGPRNQVGLERLEDTDDDSSAPVPEYPESLQHPSRRKRSYSRSFSPERATARLLSVRRRRPSCSVGSPDTASTKEKAPLAGLHGPPLQQLSSTSQESDASLSNEGESDASGLNAIHAESSGEVWENAGKIVKLPNRKKSPKIHAQTVPTTGKRRKIVSKSVAPDAPTTADLRLLRTSAHTRGSKPSVTSRRKPAVAAPGSAKPSVQKPGVEKATSVRATRSSSRLHIARSSANNQEGPSTSYPLNVARERRNVTGKKI